MKLYLKVTGDLYELPLAVADSVEELARMCGVSESTIYSSVYRHRKGQLKFSRYICVEV
ncbi:MAG: hypothetical protein IJX30_03255 [Clostridia bacterium]|nr:hypothetical protein [Clostridia bacterium]